MKDSDQSLLIKKLMHSWYVYTSVSWSIISPVLKWTMINCSSGKLNGLS